MGRYLDQFKGKKSPVKQLRWKYLCKFYEFPMATAAAFVLREQQKSRADFYEVPRFARDVLFS